mmetsp:Transcript_7134/g.8204  ORF Transcript_7134/g.8204 Transcript_7134/m.8204 type:complete len:162 (-) Transcript_7134:159-644(-)
MEQLTVMGFSRPKANIAMRRTKGNINAALDLLMAESLVNTGKGAVDRSMLGPMIRVRNPNGSSEMMPLAVLMQKRHDTRLRCQKQQKPASQTQIEELPVRILQCCDVTSDRHHSNCTVCLEDFAVKEEIRTLPCSHFFHTSCIDSWLKTSNECPICKKTIK